MVVRGLVSPVDHRQVPPPGWICCREGERAPRATLSGEKAPLLTLHNHAQTTLGRHPSGRERQQGLGWGKVTGKLSAWL